MARIISTGDNHWCETQRFSECKRVHAGIAEEVRKEKPDLVIDTGDIFDAASTPIERTAVADWAAEITDVCPLFIVEGNHDRHLDPTLFARLRTKHPIIVEAGAGLHEIAGLRVAAMAWPNKAKLAATLVDVTTPDAIDVAVREALRNILRGFRQKRPHVLAGHFLTQGAKMNAGQPQRVDHPVNLALEELGLAGAELTLMGHIHLAQEWAWNGRPILYTGSPYATEFGETEQKTFVLADVNDRGCTWERRPTLATRMLLIGDAWGRNEAGQFGWLEGATSGGPVNLGLVAAVDAMRAEIRFRYTVDIDQREPAKAAAAELKARLIAAGAVAVKVEAVIKATTRARAPEYAKARGMKAKAEAFWAAKAMAIDPERRERLFGLLAELEETTP